MRIQYLKNKKQKTRDKAGGIKTVFKKMKKLKTIHKTKALKIGKVIKVGKVTLDGQTVIKPGEPEKIGIALSSAKAGEIIEVASLGYGIGALELKKYKKTKTKRKKPRQRK